MLMFTCLHICICIYMHCLIYCLFCFFNKKNIRHLEEKSEVSRPLEEKSEGSRPLEEKAEGPFNDYICSRLYLKAIRFIKYPVGPSISAPRCSSWQSRCLLLLSLVALIGGMSLPLQILEEQRPLTAILALEEMTTR